MRRVRIGGLRYRVELQQPVRTSDGGGGAAEIWDTVAELWAAVIPVRGEERISAEAVSGEVTHEVWIRHRTGVTPSMRFGLDGRVLDIRAVIPVDDGRRLKCLCLERSL
ncbi:MAG: phage head closure protein [Bacteroidota bacterium]